jgi:hypothetical protein
MGFPKKNSFLKEKKEISPPSKQADQLQFLHMNAFKKRFALHLKSISEERSKKTSFFIKKFPKK